MKNGEKKNILNFCFYSISILDNFYSKFYL